MNIPIMQNKIIVAIIVLAKNVNMLRVFSVVRFFKKGIMPVFDLQNKSRMYGKRVSQHKLCAMLHMHHDIFLCLQ